VKVDVDVAAGAEEVGVGWGVNVGIVRLVTTAEAGTPDNDERRAGGENVDVPARVDTASEASDEGVAAAAKRLERDGEARAGISRYIDFYNLRRPHRAHSGRTPDVVYFAALPATRQAA
jgi:hypothetical protein